MLQHYLKEFESVEERNTHEKWTQHQRAALQSFLARDFLNSKDEKWRYIARSPLLHQPFRMDSVPRGEIEAIEQHLPQPTQPNILRFICLDGRFYLPASKNFPIGLKVEPIIQIMQENPEVLIEEKWYKDMQLENSFSLLNTMFSKEGLNITVADDCKIEPIIQIWYVSTSFKNLEEPRMFCARHHISVGKNSNLKMMEYAMLLNPEKINHSSCTNTLTTMNLKSGSTVSLAQSMKISDHQSHISQLAVRQEKDSVFRSESLVLGGGLVRNTLSVDLCEHSAACEMKGLTVAKQQHQVNHELFIHHQGDYTKSDIHYRSIVDNRGKVSFGGEVNAERGIHKMSSHQGNYNLLLSDDAEVNTRPRLALLADDIECTHGATIGALDEQALFYLESRGLPKEKTRLMLIEAFGETILQLMPLLLEYSEQLPNTLRKFIQQDVAS